MGYIDNMTKKIKLIKDKNQINILAIETSCDETSAAVVVNGRQALSNVIFSQIDIHRVYGGVVPEIASRNHVEKITMVVDKALKDADMKLFDIDCVAVTNGPGLVGALLVGVSTAKSLAYASSIPLIGVHHISGHISANYISHGRLEPPFLCLVVSGGHSHIIEVKDYGEYEIIGQTRDDAAGEAFDKVARLLGLGYPGGPVVENAAKSGNANAFDFPRAEVKDSPYDFSFSGIKTSVMNFYNNSIQRGDYLDKKDIAASFQQAVIDVLVDRTISAALKFDYQKIVLAGGVAANELLRTSIDRAARLNKMEVFFPPKIMCTDNAAMIGSAAYYELQKNNIANLDLNAVPNLKLRVN